MSELVIRADASREATRRASVATHPLALLAQARLWLEVWSERRALATLDPNLLADIGIDRNDALREASRGFWDIPASRASPR